MTRTEYSWHDCTIKELKDATAACQPVVCVLTNHRYTWHDYTIKELKDATAACLAGHDCGDRRFNRQPVVCVITNHEYSWHDCTIKELKDSTANPWFVSSQTTDTADTIARLKN
jgi:hypothetical protein